MSNLIKEEPFVVDLAMHMMDIAQNALRAGAGEIGIDFVVDSIASTLLFSIQDNGSGMDEETLKKLDDPFFTTRTTRKVGLGIPFLKMTCEQTGGYLKLFSESGTGSVVEAVFRTDHPDCLPLGDIAGYLALLLRANPEVRFRFSFKIDKAEFVLDSDELREQGIDLRYPEMSGAVKEYIGENLKKINRKRLSHDFLCM